MKCVIREEELLPPANPAGSHGSYGEQLYGEQGTERLEHRQDVFLVGGLRVKKLELVVSPGVSLMTEA